MTNLKEARDKGKLEDFIKEREKDEKGDDERLQKTIQSFTTRKPKENQNKPKA